MRRIRLYWSDSSKLRIYESSRNHNTKNFALNNTSRRVDFSSEFSGKRSNFPEFNFLKFPKLSIPDRNFLKRIKNLQEIKASLLTTAHNRNTFCPWLHNTFWY